MHVWIEIQETIDSIETHLGEEISVAEYIKLRRMVRATEALIQKEQRIKDSFNMTPKECWSSLWKDLEQSPSLSHPYHAFQVSYGGVQEVVVLRIRSSDRNRGTDIVKEGRCAPLSRCSNGAHQEIRTCFVFHLPRQKRKRKTAPRTNQSVNMASHTPSSLRSKP